MSTEKVTNGRKRLFLAGFIVVIIALAGFSLSRYRPASDAAAASAASVAAPPARNVVAVVPVTRRNLTRDVTVTAELTPYNVASLYAKVSGYLTSICVDYGSHVYAGETIATLALPEQQEDLARANAAYNLAKVSYDRILGVVRETPGILAQQDVDNARAAFDSARDERNRAQVMLDYTRITAPFAGVVTQRNVDIGDLISQGETGAAVKPIVEIADDERLRLVVEAPESIVPFITVGTPAQVRIQGTGQTIDARVSRFSYDVHQTTRTMHTEIDIANPDLRLKPGMYADVTFALDRHDHVVVVPTQALSTDGSPNVLIVDGSNHIRERSVDIGLQTPNWVEVTHGLSVGEHVFVGSRSTVSVGDAVEPRVVNPATGA